MSSAAPLGILVAGGGPGGLAAAVALARGGHRVELVEQASDGAPVGAAITLTMRAIEALGRVGDLDRLRAVAGDTGPLRAGALDRHGKPLGPPPAAGPPAAVSAEPPREMLGLYRPVLSAALLEAARTAGVGVRLGTAVRGVRHRADAVEVETDDGRAARHDLVIAADGVGSSLRRRLFPDAPAPRYAGQSILRWMAPGPPIAEASGVFHLPAGKLLGYALPHQALTYVALVTTQERERHVDAAAARVRLREAVAQVETPYGRELLRRLTPEAAVLWRPFEWLLVPRPWHRGRVVLLGDSAHATTAHLSSGGGMAIEDAVVLAECLRGHDVERSLVAYAERRFDRVAAVVRTSLECSRLEAAGASPAAVAAAAAPTLASLARPF